MFDIYDLLLFVQCIVYILVCPFTKVEESFNTQAVYDFLHVKNLTIFDHITFPGVVPRTFLGPILLSVLSYPFILIFNPSGKTELILVRIIFALLHVFINSYLRKGIAYRHTKKVSNVFAIFQFVQFHISFYCSRPLPNSFALLLTNLAAAFIVRNHITHAFLVLTYATVMFRSEIAVFAASLGLTILMFHPVANFRKVWTLTKTFLLCALVVLPISVMFSFLMDSYFWKRFLWPEGEVLYYNAYLNKSRNWGTQPFLWYFISALPRALLGSQLFIIPSILIRGRSTRVYYFSALCFIFLYSFLPHKEMRFIFYAFPLMNLGGAIGFVSIEKALFRKPRKKTKKLEEKKEKEKEKEEEIGEEDDQKTRSKKALFWNLFKPFILVSSFLITLLFLECSRMNYYGGDALEKFHEILKKKHSPRDSVFVHIGTHATMTGITRFLYIPEELQGSEYPTIKYTKEEITPDFSKYDYILTGTPEQHKESYSIIAVQKGFTNQDLKSAFISGFKKKIFRIDPKIYVMKNLKKLEILETSSDTLIVGTKVVEDSEELENQKKIELEKKILSYTEPQLEILRIPVMKWYQKKDRLIINMVIYDAPEVKFEFAPNAFTLVSELFRCHLEFFEAIDRKKSNVKIRNDKIVVNVFKKNSKINWPRLLKQELSPDYLKIDWDEWDDEFNIEIQDQDESKEFSSDYDPEAQGYKFDFGESFVKTLREKINPEEMDKKREQKIMEPKKKLEEFSNYLKFLEREKKRVERRRDKKKLKLEKKREEERKKMERIFELEAKKRRKIEESKKKKREHESKEFSDMFFGKICEFFSRFFMKNEDDEFCEEKNFEEYWQMLYGWMNPFFVATVVFVCHGIILLGMVTTISLSPRIRVKED